MNAHKNLTPDANGTSGTAFDGRYVYFAPSQNDNVYHGNILRYDTTGNFTHNVSNSWQLANLSNINGQETTLYTGYSGATFDGRYVYFAPLLNREGFYHGNIVRYDTTGNFNSNSTNTASGTPSWQVMEANTTLGQKSDFVGFTDPVFDGRHIYFVTQEDNPGGSISGIALRYDTTGNFTHNATNTATGHTSWQFMNLSSMSNHYVGYTGTIFDGKYVYFVPTYNGISQDGGSGDQGHILRYDSAGANSSYALQLASEADNGGQKPAGSPAPTRPSAG